MRELTRELAREARGCRLKVDVPAHDCTTWVRAIRALDVLAFADMEDAAAAPVLVAKSVCNESGELLYPDEAEGLLEVSDWPTTLFQPVLEAALEVNGLSGGGERAVGN